MKHIFYLLMVFTAACGNAKSFGIPTFETERGFIVYDESKQFSAYEYDKAIEVLEVVRGREIDVRGVPVYVNSTVHERFPGKTGVYHTLGHRIEIEPINDCIALGPFVHELHHHEQFTLDNWMPTNNDEHEEPFSYFDIMVTNSVLNYYLCGESLNLLVPEAREIVESMGK